MNKKKMNYGNILISFVFSLVAFLFSTAPILNKTAGAILLFIVIFIFNNKIEKLTFK